MKRAGYPASGAAVLGSLLAATAAGSEPAEPVVLDYALQCQGCHLADGRGSGDIPTLHGVGRLLHVPGGRDYLARVPGVSNASIDDARLAALLTWVLERWSREQLPDDFVAYDEREIAGLRTPLVDPSTTRAELLSGR